MSRAPVIVPVSDLRKDTARLIEQANRSGEPLFITQRGYVTAVLLSRGVFDTMCVLRDRALRAFNPRAAVYARLHEAEAADADAPSYWNAEDPVGLE